jgi:MFS family permease
VFAALLAPSALSLLATTFTDAKERGNAFGVYGTVAASGSAIGLLVGGALT